MWLLGLVQLEHVFHGFPSICQHGLSILGLLNGSWCLQPFQVCFAQHLGKPIHGFLGRGQHGGPCSKPDEWKHLVWDFEIQVGKMVEEILPQEQAATIQLAKLPQKWTNGKAGPPANLWTYKATLGKEALHLRSPCLALSMACCKSMPLSKNVARVVASSNSVCGLPIELEEFKPIWIQLGRLGIASSTSLQITTHLQPSVMQCQHGSVLGTSGNPPLGLEMAASMALRNATVWLAPKVR